MKINSGGAPEKSRERFAPLAPAGTGRVFAVRCACAPYFLTSGRGVYVGA